MGVAAKAEADTDDNCEDTTTTAAFLKQKQIRRPVRKNIDNTNNLSTSATGTTFSTINDEQSRNSITTNGVSFAKLDTSSGSIEERAALSHSIGKLTVATTIAEEED